MDWPQEAGRAHLKLSLAEAPKAVRRPQGTCVPQPSRGVAAFARDSGQWWSWGAAHIQLLNLGRELDSWATARARRSVPWGFVSPTLVKVSWTQG